MREGSRVVLPGDALVGEIEGVDEAADVSAGWPMGGADALGAGPGRPGLVHTRGTEAAASGPGYKWTCRSLPPRLKGPMALGVALLELLRWGCGGAALLVPPRLSQGSRLRLRRASTFANSPAR